MVMNTDKFEIEKTQSPPKESKSKFACQKKDKNEIEIMVAMEKW